MDWTRRKTNKIFAEFGVRKLFEILNKNTIKRVELEEKDLFIINHLELCERILWKIVHNINSDITNIDLAVIINCEIPK